MARGRKTPKKLNARNTHAHQKKPNVRGWFLHSSLCGLSRLKFGSCSRFWGVFVYQYARREEAQAQQQGRFIWSANGRFSEPGHNEGKAGGAMTLAHSPSTSKMHRFSRGRRHFCDAPSRASNERMETLIMFMRQFSVCLKQAFSWDFQSLFLGRVHFWRISRLHRYSSQTRPGAWESEFGRSTRTRLRVAMEVGRS